MNQTPKEFRTLAISLSSRGFGYAVMEGNSRLVAYGNKIIQKNKNARVLHHVEKTIARYRPSILAVPNVTAKGTYRHLRIKELQRKVIALAKRHKIKVVKLSKKELRNALLGNEHGSKYEMAELLAKRFPDELASRLPSRRKAWKSEDARMDTFDAVVLAIVSQGN